MQRFVGWARDDIVKLNNRKTQSQGDAPLQGARPAATPASGGPPLHEPKSNNEYSPLQETASSLPTVNFLDLWAEARSLGRQATKATVRETVNLLCYSENGALPPAPRLALFMILSLFVYGRRRRRRRRREQPPEAAPATLTPRRNSVNAAVPPGATAAGLQSPSRSLFSRPHQQRSLVSPLRAPVAPGSPLGRGQDVPPPSGSYPFLPSPAQARAAQARRGQPRVSSMRRRLRPGGSDHEAEGPMAVSGGQGGGVRAAGSSGRWAWWRMRGWTRGVDGCGRRYVLWLALLWLLASVVEVSTKVVLLGGLVEC